jgi:hypothetical protein
MLYYYKAVLIIVMVMMVMIRIRIKRRRRRRRRRSKPRAGVLLLVVLAVPAVLVVASRRTRNAKRIPIRAWRFDGKCCCDNVPIVCTVMRCRLGSREFWMSVLSMIPHPISLFPLPTTHPPPPPPAVHRRAAIAIQHIYIYYTHTYILPTYRPTYLPT